MFQFSATIVDASGDVSVVPATASMEQDTWSASDISRVFQAACLYLGVELVEALAEIRYSKAGGITLQVGAAGRSATMGPFPIDEAAAKAFATAAEWSALLPSDTTVH